MVPVCKPEKSRQLGPSSLYVRPDTASGFQGMSVADPAGSGALFLSLQERRELVTWRKLIGDAKWVLEECMQHSYKVQINAPDGTLREIELPVKPDVRAKAAIAVLAVLARNGSPIIDEADSEDQAESMADMASRALGELRREAITVEAEVVREST